jgi:hypothetical protein
MGTPPPGYFYLYFSIISILYGVICYATGNRLLFSWPFSPWGVPHLTAIRETGTIPILGRAVILFSLSMPVIYPFLIYMSIFNFAVLKIFSHMV